MQPRARQPVLCESRKSRPLWISAGCKNGHVLESLGCPLAILTEEELEQADKRKTCSSSVFPVIVLVRPLQKLFEAILNLKKKRAVGENHLPSWW